MLEERTREICDGQHSHCKVNRCSLQSTLRHGGYCNVVDISGAGRHLCQTGYSFTVFSNASTPVVGSLAIALAAFRVRPSSILAVLVCHVFCDGLSHVMVLLSSLKTRSQNPNTDGQLPDASTALACDKRSRLKAATADDARRYA